MSKTKTAPKSTVMDIWAQTAEERKEATLQLNFKLLQSKGNEYLINLQTKMHEAKAAYDAAVLASKKTPNFETIAKAQLTMAAAGVEYEKALETYKAIFGEDPTIA